MRSTLKRLASIALLAIGLFALPVAAQDADAGAPTGLAASAEAFDALPVQDGGRIKPMGTLASVTLLRLNGRKSVKFEDGTRLGPGEWLLDTLFFPSEASSYPVFLVQDDGVVAAIGVDSTGKKKRDRYSFNELLPGLSRLFELAREYGSIEEKNRSSVQQQIYFLAGNVDQYMGLAGFLDFARYPLEVPPGGELSELFGGTDVAFSDVVRNASRLIEIFRAPGTSESDREAASRLLQTASELSRPAGALAFIPPVVPVADEAEWRSPADLFEESVQGLPLAEDHYQTLVELEALTRDREDPDGFANGLTALRQRVDGLAAARKEARKIGLEVSYYNLNLVSRSLYLFILAFVAVAFMWLRPRGKILYAATWLFVSGGTLLLTLAIVMRCVIRGRPPVSTLYETVLFVTAVGLIVGLFIELIGRRRISLSSAAFLGMVGLFVANGYEMLDKKDTMPSLVAVLDTNFWLATHVTSITIGYSAGMLAALLGSVYLLAKLIRFRGGVAGDREFYSSLARMVYGVLCFGLIFSVVGTILGGIWANDSWGRFWGWDPKENGALLIVISQIAILHGRMGGYLRQHGVCMAAAFGGTVVAFSWWGVNLLGVGLHSYGFTSGIHSALWSYYGLQWGVVALGGVAWVMERQVRPAGH